MNFGGPIGLADQLNAGSSKNCVTQPWQISIDTNYRMTVSCHSLFLFCMSLYFFYMMKF